MQKTLLLVIGAFLCITITACTKTDVNPVNLDGTVQFSSLKSTVTQNRIVVLGGSTAWGVGASSPQYAWVNRLRAKLKLEQKNDTIINLALSGYTTYHIMANDFSKPKRPASDTLRNITTALTKRPMLVIISLPSNDIANGFNDDEILSNYKVVVNALVSQNIQYIITSNQPRNFSAAQRIRLRTFTDLIIKAFPGHVLDYLNILGDSTGAYKTMYNCGDGIHPNDAGHNIIYKSFITFAPFKQAVGIK